MLIAAISLTPQYTRISTSELKYDAMCFLHHSPAKFYDKHAGLTGPIFLSPVRVSLETRLKIILFLAYGYLTRLLKLSKRIDSKPRKMSYKLKLKSITMQYGMGSNDGWSPQASRPWKRQLKVLLFDPLAIALCRFLHVHLDLLTSFVGEVSKTFFCLLNKY